MYTRIRLFAIIFVLGLAGLACSIIQEPPGTPTAPSAPPAAPTANGGAAIPTSDGPQPTNSPGPIPQMPSFAVILVAEDDVLNVRSGAGVSHEVIGTLGPQSVGVKRTGKLQQVDGAAWVEVKLEAGGLGWVNARFLTEYVPPDQFCSDAQVEDLIDKFVAAVQTQDGTALADLVSPTHGLTLRHEWWNPEVHYPKAVVPGIFTDTQARDWGVQDGSGRPIRGAFKDVALPWMQDVFSSDFERHCNDIERGSGGSAGYKLWPFEYGNINYVALYRPAEVGDELNWRTWAVGVEYVRGLPYIAFLVQYHWEI